MKSRNSCICPVRDASQSLDKALQSPRRCLSTSVGMRSKKRTQTVRIAQQSDPACVLQDGWQAGTDPVCNCECATQDPADCLALIVLYCCDRLRLDRLWVF